MSRETEWGGKTNRQTYQQREGRPRRKRHEQRINGKKKQQRAKRRKISAKWNRRIYRVLNAQIRELYGVMKGLDERIDEDMLQ